MSGRRGIHVLGAVAAACIVAVALALGVGGGGGSDRSHWPSASLVNLTNLTSMPGAAAPTFTLTDQRGRSISMAAQRGKVVVFESMDPECTLECPIMAQEFVDAARELGTRGSQVVFLGINVNQYHASTADVLSFSRRHHLDQLANWHFLTGSAAQLREVWHAYAIAVQPSRTGDVTHSDLMYFIDREGREKWVAAPNYNKAAIPSWGAAIASVSAHLLG
jgi:protein SCO1